jgi:hypothetical protein
VDSVISIWACSSMRGFTQNRQIGTALPPAVMNRIRRQNGGTARPGEVFGLITQRREKCAICSIAADSALCGGIPAGASPTRQIS